MAKKVISTSNIDTNFLNNIKRVSLNPEEREFYGNLEGGYNPLEDSDNTFKGGSQYDEGLNSDSEQYKTRAAGQGLMDELGNVTARTVKVLPGIASTVGTLADLENVGGVLGIVETDYNNWLTKWAEGVKQNVDEALPLYRENPNKTTDVQDSAWWLENIDGIKNSVIEFGITGLGVGAGTSAIAKGLQAKKLLNGLGTAIEKGNQFTTALALTHAEGVITGIDVFEKTDVYARENLVFDNIQNQIIDKKDIEQNSLSNIRYRPLNDDEVKSLASDAASTAVRTNYANTLLNITSLNPLFNSKAASRALQNKALKQGIGETLESQADRLANLKWKDLKTGTLSTLAKEVPQEALEEGINVYAQNQGLAKGKVISQEDASLANSLFSEEGLNSMLWGALGAVGQTGTLKVAGKIKNQIFGETPDTEQKQFQNQRDNIVGNIRSKNTIVNRMNDIVEKQKTIAILENTKVETEEQAKEKEAQLDLLKADLQSDVMYTSFSKGTAENLHDIVNSYATKTKEQFVEEDPKRTEQDWKDYQEGSQALKENLQNNEKHYNKIQDSYYYMDNNYKRNLYNLKVTKDSLGKQKQKLETEKLEKQLEVEKYVTPTSENLEERINNFIGDERKPHKEVNSIVEKLDKIDKALEGLNKQEEELTSDEFIKKYKKDTKNRADQKRKNDISSTQREESKESVKETKAKIPATKELLDKVKEKPIVEPEDKVDEPEGLATGNTANFFKKKEDSDEIKAKKADIGIGKVGNTEYEVKVDGVYYQGKKLDNPENKTHRQLIEADIKRRRQEELRNEIWNNSGTKFTGKSFVAKDGNTYTIEESELKSGDKVIKVKDKDGKTVSSAYFTKNEDGTYSIKKGTRVESEIQGIGLASAIYNYFDNNIGKIKRTDTTTDEGDNLWNSNKNRINAKYDAELANLNKKKEVTHQEIVDFVDYILETGIDSEEKEMFLDKHKNAIEKEIEKRNNTVNTVVDANKPVNTQEKTTLDKTKEVEFSSEKSITQSEWELASEKGLNGRGRFVLKNTATALGIGSQRDFNQQEDLYIDTDDFIHTNDMLDVLTNSVQSGSLLTVRVDKSQIQNDNGAEFYYVTDTKDRNNKQGIKKPIIKDSDLPFAVYANINGVEVKIGYIRNEESINEDTTAITWLKDGKEVDNLAEQKAEIKNLRNKIASDDAKGIPTILKITSKSAGKLFVTKTTDTLNGKNIQKDVQICVVKSDGFDIGGKKLNEDDLVNTPEYLQTLRASYTGKTLIVLPTGNGKFMVYPCNSPLLNTLPNVTFTIGKVIKAFVENDTNTLKSLGLDGSETTAQRFVNEFLYTTLEDGKPNTLKFDISKEGVRQVFIYDVASTGGKNQRQITLKTYESETESNNLVNALERWTDSNYFNVNIHNVNNENKEVKLYSFETQELVTQNYRDLLFDTLTTNAQGNEVNTSLGKNTVYFVNPVVQFEELKESSISIPIGKRDNDSPTANTQSSEPVKQSNNTSKNPPPKKPKTVENQPVESTKGSLSSNTQISFLGVRDAEKGLIPAAKQRDVVKSLSLNFYNLYSLKDKDGKPMFKGLKQIYQELYGMLNDIKDQLEYFSTQEGIDAYYQQYKNDNELSAGVTDNIERNKQLAEEYNLIINNFEQYKPLLISSLKQKGIVIKVKEDKEVITEDNIVEDTDSLNDETETDVNDDVINESEGLLKEQTFEDGAVFKQNHYSKIGTKIKMLFDSIISTEKTYLDTVSFMDGESIFYEILNILQDKEAGFKFIDKIQAIKEYSKLKNKTYLIDAIKLLEKADGQTQNQFVLTTNLIKQSKILAYTTGQPVTGGDYKATVFEGNRNGYDVLLQEIWKNNNVLGQLYETDVETGDLRKVNQEYIKSVVEPLFNKFKEEQTTESCKEFLDSLGIDISLDILNALKKGLDDKDTLTQSIFKSEANNWEYQVTNKKGLFAYVYKAFLSEKEFTENSSPLENEQYIKKLSRFVARLAPNVGTNSSKNVAGETIYNFTNPNRLVVRLRQLKNKAVNGLAISLKNCVFSAKSYLLKEFEIYMVQLLII